MTSVAVPQIQADAHGRATPAVALDNAEVLALRAAIRGRVLLPGDDGYEASRRVQNLLHDRHPAVVVRPVDAVDVAHAVVAARELGLAIAVKGGGHSLAGHSVLDDSLVVDLGDMRGVEIDVAGRAGSAQGGARAGEFTLAAGAHGVAVPFGDTASVGLGGLTLGGGIGFLVRKHGLAIDSLTAVDLVTADGRLLTVSDSDDPDLFWALRGGGGSFGIATRLQYRLHPVDIVTGGALILPLTRDVVRGVVETALAAPEELTQITHVTVLPPAPFVPAGLVGTPAVVVIMVHAGDLDAGAAAVVPFRSIATPLVDMVGPMRYPDIYRLTAGGEQPAPTVIVSNLLPELADTAVDAIVERHLSPRGAGAMTQLRVMGGAMARVPRDATAFAHRDALVMATVIAHTGDDAEAARTWAAEFLGDLSPNAVGAYSNFMGDEGEDRLRSAYPGPTRDRLAEVKRRIDPDNVFRGNHNIGPA